jgi:hypothetical protein
VPDSPNDVKVPITGVSTGAPQPPTPRDAPVQAPATAQLASSSHLENIARSLDPEDLKQSGTIKMLVHDFDRAEGEVLRLSGYVERFHGANTRAALAEQALRPKNALDSLCNGLFAFGGILAGYGLKEHWVDLGIGLAMILVAVVVQSQARARNPAP